MPKNNKIQQKTSHRPSNQRDIKTLVKKNEFAIGAVTVVILAVITFFGFNTLSSKIDLSKLAGNQENAKMVGTKMVTDSTSTPSASLMPKNDLQMWQASASAASKEIKKLSNTSSFNFITVKKGDSYGRIAKKFCNNGRIYTLISELNGNIDLHPGDIIRVSCDL